MFAKFQWFDLFITSYVQDNSYDAIHVGSSAL